MHRAAPVEGALRQASWTAPAGPDRSVWPRPPASRRPILSRTRLSAAERRAVESASHATLPAGTRVLLFGSRLDYSRRGGDIDLLVELPAPLSADETVDRRTRFTARLYRLLEERRIDVVMTQQGWPDRRAVVTAARQQGIELTHT